MPDLANAIIREECVPESWEESYIINCYKGKGDARIRGNYRGLKLLEQAMKVIERVADSLIREQVDIDEMQYGFTPGRGTTDAIFILRQMQEKYVGSNKRLYMAFVDLEKAFDRVPREVLWWAMRKVGVEEWLIRLVQSITQMPGAEFGSMTLTVMTLVSKSVFIRVQSSARCYLSLYLKLSPKSSEQVVHGNFCMQMTL